MKFINNYTSLKFLDSTKTEYTVADFKDKYKQNYFYYQNETVKKLIEHLFELIGGNNVLYGCKKGSCVYTTNELEPTDEFGYPYYYKIGIGYISIDYNGNEVFSPITTYTNKDDEKLLKIIDVEDPTALLDDADTLYNKLTIFNNAGYNEIRKFIGSSYPNNFNVLQSTLDNNINVDDYEDSVYSPIQVNVITTKTTKAN